MRLGAPSSSSGLGRARPVVSRQPQHPHQQYQHCRRIPTARVHVHKEYAAQGQQARHDAAAASAAAAAAAGGTSSQQKHTSASEFTREALALLRHPDASPRALAALLPPGALVSAESPAPARRVAAGVEVVERGPLARVRGEACLDACARRVLPGHLLRRCRVLSSLAVGGGRHLQRVALVAHSGEEARFDVEVVAFGEEEEEERGAAGGQEERRAGAEAANAGGAALAGGETTTPRHDTDSDSDGDGPALPPSLRGWRIARMRRDASCDGDFFGGASSSCSSSSSSSSPSPLLSLRPTARLGPELAVLSQISRLSRGDVAGASRWCSWARRLGSGAAWEAGLRQFRETLRRPEYHALLTATGDGVGGGGGAGGGDGAVSLGPAALPSQRLVLQSVRVADREYLWEMSMQDDGVWLVRSIAAVR